MENNSDKNSDYLELFDNAVLRELNDDESLQFDELISRQEMREAFEEHRTMTHVIIEKGRKEMKQSLKNLDKTMREIEPPSNKWNTWIVLGIVLLGLLISSIWFFSTDKKKPEPAQFYANYYTPYPNEIDPLTKSTDAADVSPFQLYELKEYDKALSLLETQLDKPEAQWYYTQILIAQNKSVSAEIQLNTIISDSNSPYQEAAKWYLALVKIKSEKIEEALTILNKITKSTSSPFRKKAKELLNEIGLNYD